MLGGYLHMASLLVAACLFGGMVLFSASFAAFLFQFLPSEDARMPIRKAFPSFDLFVMVLLGLAMVLIWRSDSFSAAWMGLVMLTTVVARSWWMPEINRATDFGHRNRFLWPHGFSVLMTLAHVVLAAVVLAHMVH